LVRPAAAQVHPSGCAGATRSAHAASAPRYLPVVVVLRASGWRISDVLNLRYDTCLERTPQGWSLRGDILKTRVLGHTIPITDEIAALILAQRTLVMQDERPEDNPERYLFPSPYRQRRGHPYLARLISNALNRLAAQYDIRGEDGAIFRFRTHAFRHTKAVELLNNGWAWSTSNSGWRICRRK